MTTDMDNSEKKRRRELFAVRPLLALLDIDESQIIQSDRPDIVIPNYAGKCIGVEIMECRPSSIESEGKNRKAQANDLVRRACEKYREAMLSQGKRHTHVYIEFTDAAFRVDQNIKTGRFIERIMHEIDRHLQNDRYEKNPRLLSQEDFIAMKCRGGFDYTYVRSIHFYDISPHPTIVSPLYCYLVKCIARDHLQHAIQIKERKLAAYKALPANKEIAEYWLVLNIPQEEEYDFERYQPADRFVSRYERIYLTQREEIMCVKQ